MSKWNEASMVMEKIDRDDVAFVAAALSEDCDGIWSDERDLARQSKVRVWTTKEIVRLSRRE